MNNLNYEDRLRSLNLPSLEFWRARGDMILIRDYIRFYMDFMISLVLPLFSH